MKPFPASKKFSGFLFLILFVLINACSNKDDAFTQTLIQPVSLKSGEITASYVCNPQQSPLINKQKNTAGMVDIYTINPALEHGGNYIVTVSVNEDWALKSLQMFVGRPEDLPLSGNGYPNLDLFPVNVSFSNGEVSFSYEFSSSPASEFKTVAVHAYLKKVSKNGNAVQTEEFWIKGEEFMSQKWGSYFSYHLMPCGSIIQNP